MAGPIDISVGLHDGIPAWPGSQGFRREWVQEMERGNAVNGSAIHMDVHCGTHVEAPKHFIDDGDRLGSIALDALVGPALVIDLQDTDRIGAETLDRAVPRDSDPERLLMRTRNSKGWALATEFDPAFAALSLDGAEWVARRGLRLIGADYLSVQRFEEDPETHRVLMRAGVVILEGLDLSHVRPGEYRLTCLPLSIPDAEAAPARAILEELAR